MFPVFLGISWLCTQFVMSCQTITKDFVGVLTGDDKLTVFADGVFVGQNGGYWNDAKWFSFSSKTKLIAVSVINNPWTPACFLGVFSNRVVTDSSWKCKEDGILEDGWERTNYTDDAWPFAYIRYDNSGSRKLAVVGIPKSVQWISPANYRAKNFICRRRFSDEEKASNSTLISILSGRPTHIIRLYLDGVFIAKAAQTLTFIRDQHKLQAVQVEDRSVKDVLFIASSSNGVRTDKWWRCTKDYYVDWFLPSYDDSSWPRAYVVDGITDVRNHFIASDAKWIKSVFTANKIYCRRNTTFVPDLNVAHDTTTVSPTRLLQPSPSTVYTRTSIAGSTIASTATTGSQNSTSPPRAAGTSAPSSTDANRVSTLLIVVIAVGGVTALVIGIAVPCYAWRKRRNRRKHQTNDKWEMNSDEVIVCEELGHGAFGKVCKGILKATSCMAHGLSVQKPLKKKEKSTIIVAVKMLQENATPDQKKDFLEEISLMKAVGSHKNIVNLIGCCIKSSPNFLIVEFASKGDLLSYLRERRKKVKDTNAPYMEVRENPPTHPPRRSPDQNNPGSHFELTINDIGEVKVAFSKMDSSIDIRIESAQSLNDEEQKQDEEDSLTAKDMMSFAWQTAKGMEYLSGKGIVHRDLAARNVLVCDNKLVKVADFGLARSTLEAENVYHTTGQHNKLPVKWMSPEAINDGIFTTKSDVWSYGVLLWEIATLGGFPYPGIKNRELMRLLKRGYRMDKPDMCSEEFYQLITRCWEDNPDARPTFTALCQDLEDWMQRDTPYLDLDQLDENQPYYDTADACAVSASSGSSCEEHASENPDSNMTTVDLACDNKDDREFEFTSF